jgi:hypothetical protein
MSLRDVTESTVIDLLNRGAKLSDMSFMQTGV